MAYLDLKKTTYILYYTPMRRRYEERKKEPIRARDILSNLSSARPALIKLKGQGKDYDPLIDVIVRIGE